MDPAREQRGASAEPSALTEDPRILHDFGAVDRARAHSAPLSRAAALAPCVSSASSSTLRATGLVLVGFALMSSAGCLEKLGVDKIGSEHDLSIVDCFHLGTSHDEVTGGLDVDDEMIALDLADRADLLAAFFDEDMIAYVDFEVVLHSGLLPT
jgi:hypothetical protein